MVSLSLAYGEGHNQPHTKTSFPAFPLSFAVASVDGVDVVEESWLEEQVLWSNKIFNPYGISFRQVAKWPLEKQYTQMETRHDRHGLGALLKKSVINCFVVLSLRDVDEPSRYRKGVHWRPYGSRKRHFIILSSTAYPKVLAHELGHFFGNRIHSQVEGNIMSYKLGKGLPFFDSTQVGRLKGFAKRFLVTKELVSAANWEEEL